MPNVYGNLSNQYPNIADLTSTSTVNGNSNLSTLNTNTQNLKTSLDATNQLSDTLLSNQNSMKDIVNNESARLEQKKNSIDNAFESQKRAVYMNDNTQKRYNAYIKIFTFTSTILVITFIITLLSNYFTFIPSIAYNIIYIVLFSITIIYDISIISEIQKHEKLDYDRLELRKPNSGDSVPVADTSGIDLNFGACANEACCKGNKIYFDPKEYVCKPIDDCKNWNSAEKKCLENFECMGIQPYNNSEFIDYSII